MVAAMEPRLDLEDGRHFPGQWSRTLKGPGPLATSWNCCYVSLECLSPDSVLSVRLCTLVVEFYGGNRVFYCLCWLRGEQLIVSLSNSATDRGSQQSNQDHFERCLFHGAERCNGYLCSQQSDRIHTNHWTLSHFLLGGTENCWSFLTFHFWVLLSLDFAFVCLLVCLFASHVAQVGLKLPESSPSCPVMQC